MEVWRDSGGKREGEVGREIGARGRVRLRGIVEGRLRMVIIKALKKIYFLTDIALK